jgi:hypothetical protein
MKARNFKIVILIGNVGNGRGNDCTSNDGKTKLGNLVY